MKKIRTKIFVNLAACVISLGLLLPYISVQAQEQYNPTATSRQVKKVNLTLPFYKVPQPLEVEVVNGQVILEGDIVLGPKSILTPRPKDMVQGAGITGSRWTNSTVPYTIRSGHPSEADIKRAIKYIDSLTNLTFVERTTENNYVEFVDSTGYWSSVGMQGYKQFISIKSTGSAPKFGKALHEIGHAAGLFHEHTRQDRDSYVRIDSANVENGKMCNFRKYTELGYQGVDIGTYDYNSIMHYSPNAFSSNGQPTIVSLDPSKTFGQRDSLSRGDIQAINSLYPITTSMYRSKKNRK